MKKENVFASRVDERRKEDEAVGEWRASVPASRKVFLRGKKGQPATERMARDKNFFVASAETCHLVAKEVEPVGEFCAVLKVKGNREVRQARNAACGVGEGMDARREELPCFGGVGETVDEEDGGFGWRCGLECVGLCVGEDAVDVACDGAFPSAVAPPNENFVDDAGSNVENTNGNQQGIRDC